MQEDALNLSLDDLIRKSKARSRPSKPASAAAKGRPGSNRPARSGGRGGKEGPPQARDRDRTSQKLQVVVRNTGLGKPRGQPLRTAQARGPVQSERAPEVRNYAALEGNERWQHDKFHDVVGAVPRSTFGDRQASQPQFSARPVVKTSTKLLISNLDEKVTDEDISELFGTCGTVKRCGIHYDQRGVSTGTADVVFEREADAAAALKRYHNVALDGKPMQIEMVVPADPNVLQTLSSGISVSAKPLAGGRSNLAFTRNFQQATHGAAARNGGSYGQRGAGAGAGTNIRGRGRLTSQVMRSQQDLDDDLDSYMQE
ncbi:hypothetical protein WJX72_007103 [[Myrmecia] bisecta]|uniref:RRM domain-containing protein n=1 Tax=[Myrmecia] bisecta TaxID=41462 RepID=A0AAW1QFY1_9CHLO